MVPIERSTTRYYAAVARQESQYLPVLQRADRDVIKLNNCTSRRSSHVGALPIPLVNQTRPSGASADASMTATSMSPETVIDHLRHFAQMQVNETHRALIDLFT